MPKSRRAIKSFFAFVSEIFNRLFTQVIHEKYHPTKDDFAQGIFELTRLRRRNVKMLNFDKDLPNYRNFL